ncbi:MAG: DUF3883 domain-containing protein [Crocinitomicaceae bacterium]
MLEELLKHDNFGNERELGFVLFQALSPNQEIRVSEFTRFCTSNLFSISRSIKGIISLLDFLSFINLREDKIFLNQKTFDPNNFKSSTDYFQETHFFKCLFQKLKDAGLKEHLFNEDNLKFGHTQNQYYVKSYLIKFDLFSIRNLLISLKFLEQDQTVPDHLLINSNFTEFFHKTVVYEFHEKPETRKVPIEQLRKGLEQKDEAGKQGELFVLQYEQNRLKNHPQFNKIERIAETYTNAGYDIQSFNDLDSFIHDRYIEVKSYRNEIAFFWSKNEVEKAKQLKTKYYLYLVDRSLMNDSDYVPKIFQNPYKKIFENDI